MRLLTVWLLLLATAAGAAPVPPKAVLLGLPGTDAIGYGYGTAYWQPKSGFVEAGKPGTVTFGVGAYLPTLVYFTTHLQVFSYHKAHVTGRPVLLLLPGDTVRVQFREQDNTFRLQGRHQAELDFCLRLWRGPLHLAGSWAEQAAPVGSDTTVTLLGTSLVNHRQQPLLAYLRDWQVLRGEGDLRLAELRRTPGIRPEVAATFGRLLRLRLLQLLLAPTRPWHRRDSLRVVPPAYADTVAAWARPLATWQQLPPAACPGLGETLKMYARYQCVLAGHFPTVGTHYTQARQTLTGYYRAQVCFQILEEGRNRHQDIRRWLADYQQWVAPYGDFVRVLRGQPLEPPKAYPAAAFSDSVQTATGPARHLTDVLAAYRGRVLLLDVWASWCLPCREEMPQSAALARRYGPRGLAVLYLSIDQQATDWRQALRQVPAGPHYRFLRPEASAFRQELELRTVPRYLLFGRDGTLLNPDALRPADARLGPVLEKLL